MSKTYEELAAEVEYLKWALEQATEVNCERIEITGELRVKLSAAEARVDALQKHLTSVINAACQEGAGRKLRTAIDEAIDP